MWLNSIGFSSQKISVTKIKCEIMATYIKAYLYCGLKTYLTVISRQWVVTTNILKNAEKKMKQTKKKPLDL